MPVSEMLFDHDAKVSGDPPARFADRPRHSQGSFSARRMDTVRATATGPWSWKPTRREDRRRMRAGRPSAVADGLAAIPPGHGDHADRGAALRPQPALAHIGDPGGLLVVAGPARSPTSATTSADLAADADLPALVSRTAPGRQTRFCSADTALRDSRGQGQPLPAVLLTDSARPQKTDPALLCANFGRRSTDAPASRPSWPGRVSATRLTLYHRARALHARQAGSRLPLAAEDGRSQISGDLRAQRKA